MRVTIVGINYAPEPTGIAPYTTGLAAGLVKLGDEVLVVTGYPHYPQWRVAPGYTGMGCVELIDSVVVKRVRHYVPARPGLVKRLVMELVFGVRAICTSWGASDAVLVVSPALFSSTMALLKARMIRARRYVWVQDIYSLGVSESGTGGAFAARVLRWVEKSTLRSVTGVFVIHDRFKRYLVESLGVDADTITVIRNWSHIDDVGDDKRTDVRRARGWTDNDVIVLHAGNMGAKQGLENVVHASELAARDRSRVKFVLLGDGNQRRALQAMGGNERLEYLDPLPDGEFEATLAAADVLLVNERPGLTEMCVPSKLTSYFATGLPVIAATDETSITAEELAHARAGIRVDAGDPGQLLAAAETLAADPAASSGYGASGRAFKASYLSETAAILRFREQLENATAAPAPIV